LLKFRGQPARKMEPTKRARHTDPAPSSQGHTALSTEAAELSSAAARETFLNYFFGGQPPSRESPLSDWAVGEPVQKESKMQFP